MGELVGVEFRWGEHDRVPFAGCARTL